MTFWRNRMHAHGFNKSGWIGRAVLLLVLAGLAWPVGVAAQDAEGMKVSLDRMNRLERDIRSLNRSLAKGAPAPVAKPGPTSGAASKPGAVAPAAQPGGSGGGPALARLNVRLSDLENDLRTTTGAMEEFTYLLSGINKRLDKLVADVDYRLGVLEGRNPGTTSAAPRPQGQPRISAAPAPPPVQKIIPGQPGSFAQAPQTLGTVSVSAVNKVSPSQSGDKEGAKTGKVASTTGQTAARPSPQSAVQPTVPAAQPIPAAPAPAPVAARVQSALPKGTPKEQYDFAFGLLRQANYDKAETALKEFVKLYPKEKLASNARYWLGETYYVRAAYVQAAEIFLEGYQTDPKGAKAPDSLLKLGMSLAGLDKKREACAAFNKVIKDYPGVSAGLKNTVTREKQKNGCS